MHSTFDSFKRLGPAAFLLEAILFALLATILLLGFILLRRAYRKRYFAARDARVFQFRQQWDALISGALPYETWRGKAFDRRIVETMVLDAFEAAKSEEAAILLKFMRSSGLIEKSIFEARNHRGWRRLRALVSLGRTRAPEAIPALAEGLRDRNVDIRLAALRGLGRMASPEAAMEILTWIGEAGLAVPALPLQNALILCCEERPQVLLPHLQYAPAATRELLGRVLSEVATSSMGTDLLEFVEDDLPELRAAAARGLSQAEPDLAIEVLNDLVDDPIWFVRLRAVVSLGKLAHPDSVPALLRGLCDSHRLVRFRAAEALVHPKQPMIPIFEKVVAQRDKYGLHAYLTAVEKAGLQNDLAAALSENKELTKKAKGELLALLHAPTLPGETSKAPKANTSAPASQP